MANHQVLIVGAGPTGLVLALRLARHGVPFRLIDQNSGPGQASRAMAVHARTLEFYQQLGFADEVVARGIEVDTLHLREAGREAATFMLKDMGEGLSPYPFVLCFPQDDHERFLVERLEAEGAAVEWGTRLRSFTQDETGVRAVLEHEGAEQACAFDYVCGCDGAHSRVRETLELGFPGGTYSQLHYVADVKLAEAVPPDGFMNVGAHAFALLLPVRSSGMHRIISMVPPQLIGRSDVGFEDLRPDVEPLLGVRVAAVNWFSTYHVHHRVAAHFRVGRCFIAGDAGHVHSPAGGQGMNTGIGDAVNLSWKLADVLQGRAGPKLLDTYEAERIAFARRLVATTDRAFTGLTGQGTAAEFFRTIMLPHMMGFLTGFSAVRRMIFKTVSQVRISYRYSGLGAGQAGEVHGGDRLPWVADGQGGNFAPLRSLQWQAHVYGAVDPGFSDAASALGIPVHGFAWNGAAREAGLRRNAAYLVRPDGHVALALPRQHAAELGGFLSAHTLDLNRATEGR